MTTAPPPPPPGWYAYEDGQRYWDGANWTATAPPQPAPTTKPGPVPRERQPRPPATRGQAVFALVVVAVALALTAIPSAGYYAWIPGVIGLVLAARVLSTGTQRAIGTVSVILFVIGTITGIVNIFVATSSHGSAADASDSSINQEVAGDTAQGQCHDLIAARLGTGIVYSKESTDADQNGKGPHLELSGTAAQNGVQYAFLCSATANLSDGTVSAVKLEALTQ